MEWLINCLCWCVGGGAPVVAPAARGCSIWECCVMLYCCNKIKNCCTAIGQKISNCCESTANNIKSCCTTVSGYYTSAVDNVKSCCSSTSQQEITGGTTDHKETPRTELAGVAPISSESAWEVSAVGLGEHESAWDHV